MHNRRGATRICKGEAAERSWLKKSCDEEGSCWKLQRGRSGGVLRTNGPLEQPKPTLHQTWLQRSRDKQEGQYIATTEEAAKAQSLNRTPTRPQESCNDNVLNACRAFSQPWTILLVDELPPHDGHFVAGVLRG